SRPACSLTHLRNTSRLDWALNVLAVFRDRVRSVGADGVASAATVDGIPDPVSHVDRVVAGPPEDLVLPDPAGDRVLAGPSPQRVVSGAAVQGVVSSSAAQDVVPAE